MDQVIKNFFYPGSICIPGASSKEKSIGYEILKTIVDYQYSGKIYPVNPNSDRILGLKCYPSISSIPDQIDLGIIVVPKKFAEVIVDELLEKQVNSIILITAGFKETGKEGEETENRIIEKITSAGARLVGPNCMGIINTLDGIKLNATFVAEHPEKGSTGFLSQSGALGAAVLNSLRETDIKLAHFISVGNKADINEIDILHFWHEDENVKILTFYLESFIDGQKFVEPIKNGKITKPVLVLKAGKTRSGMKAASSHTGALGSSDKVVEAVLDQFGVLRVNTINELFNTAKGFENFPLPSGNKVAVITNAGGPAILAVDSLEKQELVVAELSSETKKRLREVVHVEGSVENPIDLLPGATAEIYKKVNEIVLEDENVDAVISIFVEPVMVQPFQVVEAVYSINTAKPLLQVHMPLPEFWNYYREKSVLQKPVFRNPEEPAEVISNMLFYKKRKGRISRSLNTRLSNTPSPVEKKYKQGFLTQEEVIFLAEKYNIPVVKSNIVNSDALHTLTSDCFPLVLKGLSEDVIHKSEFNAVKINIKTKEELFIMAEQMKRDFRQQNLQLENFLIQSYVKVKHEILVGGFRDDSFGPMIMFGTGGKYVEIYGDTVIKSAYLSEGDINHAIKKTAMGQILKGVRGETPADMSSIRTIIKNAARMLIDIPEISEFDINPLAVSEDNSIVALDIRIKV